MGSAAPLRQFNGTSNPNHHLVHRVAFVQSEERFWTLMWDVRERYGTVDKYAAQHILCSTYIRDRDTGEKIRFARDDDGRLQLHAHAKWSVQGGTCQEGRETGTNTAKVTVLDGPQSMVSWTLGNPSDWQGGWDEYFFDPMSQLDRKWWLRQ